MLIQDHPDGVILRVKVQPRASGNRIAGILNDELKIAITAPPVEGAANTACIEFVAAWLGLAKNRVEIMSGHTGRSKRLKICGISSEDLQKKIED